MSSCRRHVSSYSRGVVDVRRSPATQQPEKMICSFLYSSEHSTLVDPKVEEVSAHFSGKKLKSVWSARLPVRRFVGACPVLAPLGGVFRSLECDPPLLAFRIRFCTVRDSCFFGALLCALLFSSGFLTQHTKHFRCPTETFQTACSPREGARCCASTPRVSHFLVRSQHLLVRCMRSIGAFARRSADIFHSAESANEFCRFRRRVGTFVDGEE